MTHSEQTARGEVAVPRNIFDFLMGVADLNGDWFGDTRPGYQGAFWWREVLRACDRASLSPADNGALGEALKPFAKLADTVEHGFNWLPDTGFTLMHHNELVGTIKLADLRRARSALFTSPEALVTREFTNELGNRIKITIEGPTSVSENTLTPLEVSELRAALSTTTDAVRGEVEAKAWDWLRGYAEQRSGEHENDVAYDSDQMVDAYMAGRSTLHPSPEDPIGGQDVELRLAMFLEILSAIGGASDASDYHWNWIQAFCEAHEGRDPDTFNLAADRGFTTVSHDSDTDESKVRITDKGRDFLAATLRAPIERKGEGIYEECAAICEQQAQDFLSPQYATGQPISSIQERFACAECARAIRAAGDKA